MVGRRHSYFDLHSSSPDRIQQLVALQRGVIGSRIHLIASACYPFDSVLRALAEPSSVLPVEGTPGDRYLPASGIADDVELEGADAVLEVFGRPVGYGASLQPHSGTQANQIVFNTVLEPDDRVLCLRPRDGGHISHSVLISRRHETDNYRLTDEGAIDYDHMRDRAVASRPKLIIVGGSSLPRAIDFERCGEIAREVGAYLHADVSHTATFIAAGLHPSVFPHCDFATFSTGKNLRGPNAGVLLFRDDLAKRVQDAIFPTTQGGTHENQVLAKLACFLEWIDRDIESYARSVVETAQRLGDGLTAAGLRLVTGGTDCHLLLADLSGHELDGATLELRLEASRVLANKNLVPGDRRSPRTTSGIRFGATNLAILGYELDDVDRLAAWLAEVIQTGGSDRGLVDELVDRYQGHLVAPVW